MLLNNGTRKQPHASTTSNSVPDLAGESQPFENQSLVAGGGTSVDMLLYCPEVEVGSRGDIIQFYNKVFIGFIKDFVTRFSPSDDVSWSSSQDILFLSTSTIL